MHPTDAGRRILIMNGEYEALRAFGGATPGKRLGEIAARAAEAIGLAQKLGSRELAA